MITVYLLITPQAIRVKSKMIGKRNIFLILCRTWSPWDFIWDNIASRWRITIKLDVRDHSSITLFISDSFWTPPPICYMVIIFCLIPPLFQKCNTRISPYLKSIFICKQIWSHNKPWNVINCLRSHNNGILVWE